MGKYAILMFVAVWIIQAVASYLAKKKEEERLQDQGQRKRDISRQRTQAARVGGIQGLSQRNPPTTQTLSQSQSAASRQKAQLQELRQRRDQQLDELRRRRQLQQQSTAQARAIPTQQQPPTSRQISQRPTLARQSRGLAQRPLQSPQPIPSRKAQTTQHSVLHSFEEERQSKQRRQRTKAQPKEGRLLVDRPSEPVVQKLAPTTSLRSMLGHRKSLRQAFILKELLDKPVSLRETEPIC